MKEIPKLLVSVIALIMILLVTILFPEPSHLLSEEALIPVVAATFPSPIQVPMMPGIPVHMSIESIHVDADIEPLGKNEQNKMEAPLFPMDAGWYKDGSRPGEIGSAVIDGHVNWFHKASAVFAHLHEIQIDDHVIITDDGGVVRTFVVERIERYSPNADTAAVFQSNDSLPRLNLITCDGLWDDVIGTHALRLVIFTVEL